FLKVPAPTDTYPLSLHDALPISTNAAGVRFAVSFSEAVSGVDAGDFALTTSGTSGASITSVSGSGASYTVTVTTGTGDGAIRLEDRKSTRLNSSHDQISYAVFCL